METIELTSLERDLIELIGARRGKENAIPRDDLCALIDHVDDRRIRRTIKHLVTEHGVAIASGPEGYYSPATAEELALCCDYYHSYAMSCLTVESRLRKVSMPTLLGQIQLKFTTGNSDATEGNDG